MKYHGHIIKKVFEDLGYEENNMNYVYYIYENEQAEAQNDYLNVAWSLTCAKDYIDSGHDPTYL